MASRDYDGAVSGLSQPMFERRLHSLVQNRLDEEIVIAIQGPRSVGKSTLLRTLAADVGADVLDLDDLAVRAAVSADPTLFASAPPPVYIDEYQQVPLLLDAIKAELNRSSRPGRYVLTGSTRFEALPRAAQALTGRMHLMTLLPLSQGEISGISEDFVERCLEDPVQIVTSSASTTTRAEYIERVTAGGFPLALKRPAGAGRDRWFDDYVTQSIERDVLALSNVRRHAALPRLLARLAGQTGQVLNITAAAEDSGIERRTADDHSKLLEAVFLVRRLPAWGTTLTSRSGSAPKVHVVDSGLAARLLGLSPVRLATLQPAALTEFGHLLETFVVGELLKQASWSDAVSGFGHWRTRDGDEVDLVLERQDGSVVGFEVKAGMNVPRKNLTPLMKLRDRLGDQFLGGVALYTGTRSYTADDRIHVVPIDRLWATSAAA